MRGEKIFMRKDMKKKPLSSANRAKQLEEKLWGGFAEIAVGDLEALRISPRSTPAEAVRAALALSRYYAANEQFEKALNRLAFVRSANPSLGRHKRVRLTEIHCLLGLGQTEDAHYLINKSLEHGNPADGCMNAALASLALAEQRKGLLTPAEAAQQYMEAMSRPLLASGLVGIRQKDLSRPLALDNIAPASPPPIPESMPAKVSVLMAVFNGADNVEPVIRSILEQSWHNLELVIADDASTDNSWEIITQLAQEDNRIIPIRQEVNGGAYVARNAALEKATGDFVVVNDADDWAHPQKIEAQVRHLLDNENAKSNMTFRVRVGPDMAAQPRLDSPHVPIIHNDYSALMLPRTKALEIGGWDAVRFSADAEFVERLRAIEGRDAVNKIYPDAPISFSLFDGNNLTASSATSIWTNRFGSRHEYVQQFTEWHHSGENLKTQRTSQTLPFPVPGISCYGKNHEQAFDIILVSDFRLPGGTTHCNLQYLHGFAELGLKVGILPWERYELSYPHARNTKITRACRELGVVPLAHGESANCKLLLIHHPPIMMHKLDRFPDIQADEIAILANQSAQRIRSGENEMYEPTAVQELVTTVFGKPGKWIPISGLIRRLMEEDGRFEPIVSQDWIPMLDLADLQRDPLWRGDKRKSPIIGRHSRDQWIKWPGNADDLAAAYLADTKIEVRLMGGAATAKQILNRIPENWKLLEFDAVPVAEFLSDLDFFVHFIHDDAIEAFGRNIAEAMAAGIPVICSPSFRECFGDAAVYAEPREVEKVVGKLWQDEKAYYKQVSAGQEFIRAHCNRTVLQSRLQEILPAEPSSVSNA
jgi:glycosyltransferase involved in cell wall biosynthesis